MLRSDLNTLHHKSRKVRKTVSEKKDDIIVTKAEKWAKPAQKEGWHHRHKS
jgi:hypothetical protein